MRAKRSMLAACAVLALVLGGPLGRASAGRAIESQGAAPPPKVKPHPARTSPGFVAPAGGRVAIQEATRLGFCGGDDWEPEIAADDPYVYVVWAHFPGNPSCDPASGNPQRVYIQVSDDRGLTFGPPHVVADNPGGTEYPAQVDATVTVNERGIVFVCFLAYGFGPIATDVGCARSNDRGRTFPISRIINGAAGCFDCDHEWPVARGNQVYVAYSGNGNNDHFISRSSDGGLTWKEHKVKDGPPFEVAFAEGAVVDAQGNAWFAWGDCKGGCVGTRAAVYRVSRTIAGTAHTDFVDIAIGPQGPDCPLPCGFAYLGPQDDIAIDAAGTLYLLWQDAQVPRPKAPPIVKLASCAAGRNCLDQDSWDYLGRVDDKDASGCPDSGCYAQFPRIEGGRAGHVAIMWMDDRMGRPLNHNNGWNVWLRRSVTGGRTWTGPSVRVSEYDPSRPESRRNGFLFPYGDYEGIDLLPDGTAVMTWGEGLDYNATIPGHVLFAAVD